MLIHLVYLIWVSYQFVLQSSAKWITDLILGVYLTDLTFLDDGNQNTLNGRDDMINFDKRRKISYVIREIQQYPKLNRIDFTSLDTSNHIHFCQNLLFISTFLILKVWQKRHCTSIYLISFVRIVYWGRYSLICEPRGGRTNPNQNQLTTRFLLKKLGFEAVE
jgi:hypothetical protein